MSPRRQEAMGRMMSAKDFDRDPEQPPTAAQVLFREDDDQARRLATTAAALCRRRDSLRDLRLMCLGAVVAVAILALFAAAILLWPTGPNR